MYRVKIYFSPGAILFVAAMIYLFPFGFFISYVLAVTAHEMGHVFALLVLRKKILSLQFEMRGILIEHSGGLSPMGNILCCLSGPAAGIIFSYIAAFASVMFNNNFFTLCSGLSLMLSFYNLLPILPLDGGRALKYLLQLFVSDDTAGGITWISGLIICGVLLIAGILLAVQKAAYGLFIAAMVLLIYLLLDEGIVKKVKLR